MKLKATITVLALTGLLLTGCASNEAAEETTDTKDITSQPTSTEKGKETVNVPLVMEFSTSLDALDILELTGYDTPSEIDGDLPGYMKYEGMMTELVELTQSNFDDDTKYTNEDGTKVQYTPEFSTIDLSTMSSSVSDDSDLKQTYDEFMLNPLEGIVTVMSKDEATSRNGAVAYERLNKTNPDGTNMSTSSAIVYENDDVAVYINSNIINTNVEENPQGDDLINLFSSDEATAIYKAYLN